VTTAVVTVFGLVYLGMILGGLPFLQLDRTGVALLGAIALVAVGALSLEEAARSVHLPTLILLFAFMVMSAQMRLGGFYTWVSEGIAGLPLAPPMLLGALIFTAGALAAVFSNDVVCLAVAPVLIEACRQRRLDPLPYLLGLACAANVGSAATLIGNPQNMLIGETLRLSFAGYFREALAPVVIGLFATWWLLVRQVAGRWNCDSGEGCAEVPERRAEPGLSFDRWQTAKGLVVVLGLLAIFLTAPWPRELAALAAAGLLLTSRRLHSRKMLGLVDWELLVLFIGLFVVNHAMQQTGLPGRAVEGLAAWGLDLREPAALFAAAFVLSNVVSNVPAVMLLLPVADHPQGGLLLALASTLAGNLLIVGSIANIIVVGVAERRGILIDWRRHARVGVPVTLVTLGLSAVWLWWWAGAPAST
jgi:Na+/H+ antiporter NhaD/arsenite permease-like protein